MNNIAELNTLYFKWLQMREAHNLPIKNAMGFFREAQSSALLRRIIAKEEVYKIPPPCYFAYPWYSLIEKNGSAIIPALLVRNVESSLYIAQQKWYRSTNDPSNIYYFFDVWDSLTQKHYQEESPLFKIVNTQDDNVSISLVNPEHISYYKSK